MYLGLQLLYNATLVAVTVAVSRTGGRAERLGIGIVFTGSMLTWALQETALFDWASARGGLIAVDLGVLFSFFALSARSDRFWPLWATAFHLIGVTTHLVLTFSPARVLQAYALVQGVWAYPIFACIVVGCVRHQRRLRQGTATPGIAALRPGGGS